ncbi:MAG: S49 family peptidase [Geminicoccaceae bacterium]|jgi:signal peptide peptidase SppA
MFSFPNILRRWRRPTLVPAVRLAGVIGSIGLGGRGMTLAGLERALDAAFGHKHARAVALLINSPGGSPVQSALIAGRIRSLAEEKKLPVLAFVEDVAASGGYWLACAADEIFADPSSIVGSIGVVSAGFGFAEAIGRLGIERRVHATGARKALLDPFRPERTEDLVLLREIQDEILGRFVAHVRARRGDRLRGEDGELFDGRVWTGDGALRHGLIDGLGEARTTIRSRFGKEARLVLANPKRGWLLRRLRFGAGPAHMADDLVAALEARAHWQRFGL